MLVVGGWWLVARHLLYAGSVPLLGSIDRYELYECNVTSASLISATSPVSLDLDSPDEPEQTSVPWLDSKKTILGS